MHSTTVSIPETVITSKEQQYCDVLTVITEKECNSEKKLPNLQATATRQLSV